MTTQETSSQSSASRVSFRACDLQLAYLLLRLTMGMNFLMHGSARLLSGEDKFVAGMMHTFQASPLPPQLVWSFGTALPWFEAAIGFLVLIGLFTRVALTAGALVITILTFGVGMVQNWETAGLQLPYALVFAVLVATISANRYSLDTVLRRKTEQ